LSLNLAGGIVQILLLFLSLVLMVHFAMVILTPLEAFFFYYGFGQWLLLVQM
jgi:hypothetical protein